VASARVYLAGPDVFLPDALGFAARKKEICSQHGLVGVFPLDAEIDLEGVWPREAGLKISRANEELIRGCQVVIAHITPFRGPSADVGTAYEMGFARALGLRVFAYTNVEEDFASRTTAFVGAVSARPNGQMEDPNHMSIESFALTDNLMLVGAVTDSGGIIASGHAAIGELYTELRGFRECVVAAARLCS
jgi:nucleoside 2-deoxyribosyltransferase